MTLIEITQILANVAGVVAALGVVLSLVYLSAQVRDNSKLVSENTKAQLMAADMSSNDGSREMAFELIKDVDLAQLVLNGLRGEDLQGADLYRFQLWIRSILESHMTFFVQLERGTVTDEIFQYWSNVFDRLSKQPGFVFHYHMMRDDLKPSFRAYMDKKVDAQNASDQTAST